MKTTLLAILAIILMSTQANASDLGNKIDKNPEITVDDVIVKDHQITADSTNCFESKCAYEYYIRNQNDVRRLYWTGARVGVNNRNIAIGIYH